MPCYSPLTAYRAREFGANGKRGVTFDRGLALTLDPIRLPCLQCIGCRLVRSREWAIRCMHEKQMHETADFITCTYDEDHLPSDNSLDKRHFQLFLKRLRKSYGRFRYYYCGEYGGRTRRPHYHAIIYGLTFPDKVFYKKNERGDPLFKSAKLDSVWQNGFCTIGDVTYDSALYVASYVVDKITGDRAAEHYTWYDANGRPHALLPEFTDMSRRPGIGAAWYARYGGSVRSHDSVVVAGREFKPPRYYDNFFSDLDALGFEDVQAKRRAYAMGFLNAEKALETKDGLSRRLVNHIVAHSRHKTKGSL